MFTHFPPPPKPEMPPTDIVQYLKIYNKKLMETMFVTALQKPRFDFKYGGLGDHLFYSHLPRIAKESKKYTKVYLIKR